MSHFGFFPPKLWKSKKKDRFSSQQQMKTVAVLGGGIAGLAASFYLCRSPQVTKVRHAHARAHRRGNWRGHVPFDSSVCVGHFIGVQ